MIAAASNSISNVYSDVSQLAFSSRNLLLNNKDLIKAGKIAKEIISFKKKLSQKKITKKLILLKKYELKKMYNIKIEYFELRNIKNLKLSNKISNSKIFIAYYLKNIRLIDNF